MDKYSGALKKSYLAFNLNKELFAVSVHNVLEILEPQYITKVPNSPDYMKGVFNFRGDVLPLIDARTKFNMPERQPDSKYVIIVLEIKVNNSRAALGLLVDGVNDVIELSRDDLKDVPKTGFNYSSDIILGMYNTGKGFMMLLDVNLIFSTTDMDFSKSDNE